MTDTSIQKIIDIHLSYWVDNGLNSLPQKIELKMTNPDEEPNEEGWQKWYPIDSTITDTEIEELETQLNFQLPSSYKTYLKYKHFYELYISEARFSGQEIKGWRRYLVDMAFDGYPRELLIDKGYIPFADWSDWGVLCFDTNQPNSDFEYPVVLWDHERCDTFESYSENFTKLLLTLDTKSRINSH